MSDKTGKINLFISKDLNVDHHSYDIGEGRVCEEVDAIALDDYFLDDIKIDFIKIDIQGYEPIALKGMSKIMRQPGRMIVLGNCGHTVCKRLVQARRNTCNFSKAGDLKLSFLKVKLIITEK